MWDPMCVPVWCVHKIYVHKLKKFFFAATYLTVDLWLTKHCPPINLHIVLVYWWKNRVFIQPDDATLQKKIGFKLCKLKRKYGPTKTLEQPCIFFLRANFEKSCVVDTFEHLNLIVHILTLIQLWQLIKNDPQGCSSYPDYSRSRQRFQAHFFHFFWRINPSLFSH